MTFSLLIGGRAVADNSTIASIYNGALSYCPKIQESEMDPFKTKCEASKLHTASDRMMFHALSYRIYEETAFAKVDQNQLLKNKCLIEQLNLYLNSDEKAKQRFANFRLNLASAWMGIRDAEMILTECNRMDRDSAPTVYPLTGPRPLTAEQQAEKKRKYGDLIELCGSPDRRKALAEIRNLSLYSLPTISAPEFFKVMQKHRNLITVKKTGLPVTDAELRKMNLQDLSSLQVGTSKEFEKDLSDVFNAMKSQRQDMNAELSKPHQFPDALNQSLRDEEFREGTVRATLQEVGVLPFGYRTLQDAKNSGQQIDPGPGCLMSRYESTSTGEWADFFAKTTFLGGLSGARSESAGVVQKMKEAFNAGLIPAMPIFLGHTAASIIEQCKAMYTTQDTATEQWGAYIKADQNLPKQVGYYRAGSDSTPEETPSCTEAMDKNLIVRLSPSCGKVIFNNIAQLLGLSKVPLEALVPLTVAPEVYNSIGP